MTWAKELLANILVQPIHTFCITVILLLPASSHGFDNLIALYAIIPFTSMVRSLFFGPAGGFVDQVAGKGAAVTNGAIAGAAMGAASRAGGGLLNFAKDKLGGGGSGSGRANTRGKPCRITCTAASPPYDQREHNQMLPYTGRLSSPRGSFSFRRPQSLFTPFLRQYF